MDNNIRKRRFKDGVYRQLARIGKALSSARRLELVDLLSQSDRTVEDLAKDTGMSVANTSQHLQHLQAARLVVTEKRGRFVRYRLADVVISDFLRSFRLLAEDRFAEIDQLRRRFFQDDVRPIDRHTLLMLVRRRRAIVIDVRPENEYAHGHIEGALSIPLADLKERLAELPRKKAVVAYCRGSFCVLAHDAVQLLRSRGFRAMRLEDSVQDWAAEGLPFAGELAVRRDRSSIATVERNL